MRELLKLACEAAIRAGQEILKIYNDPQQDFSVEKKADNSPLTIADKTSHLVIDRFLSTTNFHILSEEGREIGFEERKEWETLWIVDPLDGTKEFIKRNDEFTVNIALVENGSPILGVIYVPVLEELYFAAKGIGSYKLNSITDHCINLESFLETAQKLPNKRESEGFVVVASRSHLSEETSNFINSLKAEYPIVDLMSKGSSLKLCMVAEGTADVYPRYAPTMEWDTAAGHAIVKYAGKEVFKVGTNQPIQYNKESLLNPYFIVK